jgi:hypothetical protein
MRLEFWHLGRSLLTASQPNIANFIWSTDSGIFFRLTVIDAITKTITTIFSLIIALPTYLLHAENVASTARLTATAISYFVVPFHELQLLVFFLLRLYCSGKRPVLYRSSEKAFCLKARKRATGNSNKRANNK